MSGQRTSKSTDHNAPPIDTTNSSSSATNATPSTTSMEPEDERAVEAGDSTNTDSPVTAPATAEVAPKEEPPPAKAKKEKQKAAKKGKSKKSKKVVEESSSESSSSDDDGTSSSSSDDESTDDERAKRRERKRVKKEKEKKKAKAKAKAKAKKRKSKKDLSSSEDSDSDSSSSSSSSSSSDADSESEKDKKSKQKRKEKAKAKAKAKKRKSKKYDSSSEDSDSDSSLSSSSSDSDSDSEGEKKRRKKKKKSKSKESEKKEKKDSAPADQASAGTQTTDTASSTTTTTITMPPAPPPQDFSTDPIMASLKKLLLETTQEQLKTLIAPGTTSTETETKKADEEKDKEKEKKKKSGKPEYKRVDQVWDNDSRDYKLVDSAEKKDQDVDSIFAVRRKFNWQNQYQYTILDIKSKLLQRSLVELLKDVKGLSLTEDTPEVDPNLLFLYYDEIRRHYKKTLKARLGRQRSRKQKKQLTEEIAHCKLLVRYIDKDYKSIRKRLNPMLKAGTITYDLIWALFKPKTIAYTPTYGNQDDPRCFKVEYCTKEENYMEEEWWEIEGRYLEYDGKKFGLGDHVVKIEAFKGTRKITSLATYPLAYHKDPEGITKKLVERGKKFIALQGMNYRHHTGLAYQKIKGLIKKHNINGRVMVDPAIFRRINPNYPLSYLKNEEEDAQSDSDDSDCDSCYDSESEDEHQPRMRWIIFKDKNGHYQLTQVPVKQAADVSSQKLDPIEAEDNTTLTFTEEELLIASPVVLGFSFKGKTWLEFSLSGVRDIDWNSGAFDSLVLPNHIKQNLRGLVSSHRFNAAQTIDDVIQGKGKGLNVVLHGPPGVGKTLTAESIADYLQCPLYVVSTGELGTNSRSLEADLNRIMDVTHSWGAILLLDEADVFMEQRQPQDVHRNALVSVFLRLLEYYQGILFLTTNRVTTFDEAFQSRIHMGIRYENLNMKARREVWQQYIKEIEASEKVQSVAFTDDDLEQLSRKDLNGRQIKNAIGQAQLIAMSEKKPFSMVYIKRTLAVTEEFEQDMRGGGNHVNLYT